MDVDPIPIPGPIPGALEDEEQDASPLSQLTTHWLNERQSPTILPAQDDLLTSLLDHIRRQTDVVQLLRLDPSTSEEEHLRIILVQTEVERVKFLVRSYIRCRLDKVERYARHILTSPLLQRNLTTAELGYARGYAELEERHLHLTVLQSLPESQSHLDDTPLFVPPLISKPNQARPVFARAKEGCYVQNGALRMEKGHISLLPFEAVESQVVVGNVELV